MSVNEMRMIIKRAYPKSPTWKEKVTHMCDEQVIAIYYDFQKRGMFNKKKNTQSVAKTIKKPEYVQMSFFN